MSSSTYIDKHVSALIRIHNQGSINDRDLINASISLLHHVNNKDKVFYDKPKTKKNAGIRVAQNAHRSTIRRNPLEKKGMNTPGTHEYHTANSRNIHSKRNKLIASLQRNAKFNKLKMLNI
jgi:hypothetical protein